MIQSIPSHFPDRGQKCGARNLKKAKSLWWKKESEKHSVAATSQFFLEMLNHRVTVHHVNITTTIPNHNCGNLEIGEIPKADATCSEKGVGSIEPASQFDTSLHLPKPCCEIDLELGGILCIISLEAY